MNDPKEPVEPITLTALFRLFLTMGAISFGGGVVAYMREYFVRDRKWMDDDDFLDALEISETLPGLNSVNMSVIVGDRLRGGMGALVATLGMILPGAVMLMILGALYVQHRQNPAVNHFLTGVAAAAVGLLLAVTLQLGHKQLVHLQDAILVALTFVAVSWLRISLWLVLLIIGPAAVLLYRPRKLPGHRFRPFRSREPGHLRRHD
jgi:chromate transporter